MPGSRQSHSNDITLDLTVVPSVLTKPLSVAQAAAEAEAATEVVEVATMLVEEVATVEEEADMVSHLSLCMSRCV